MRSVAHCGVPQMLANYRGRQIRTIFNSAFSHIHIKSISELHFPTKACSFLNLRPPQTQDETQAPFRVWVPMSGDTPSAP